MKSKIKKKRKHITSLNFWMEYIEEENAKYGDQQV